MPAGRPIVSPLCATCGTDDPALFYPKLKRVCRKCYVSEKKIYYETRKVNSGKNTVKKLNEQNEQTPLEKLTVRIQLLESQLSDLTDKLDIQKKFDDILIAKMSEHSKRFDQINDHIDVHAKSINMLYGKASKGFTSAFV